MLWRSWLSAALLLLTITPTSAKDLTIQMDGITPGAGPVLLLVCDHAEQFDHLASAKEQAPVALRFNAPPPSISLTLHDLPDVAYAAVAYQDSNRNGVLDRNLLGIPTEPYGFSTPTQLGKPRFADAAQTSAAGYLRIHLKP